MDDKINNGRPLPPVETRWKPGESGNPKGRPPKKNSLSEDLDEILQEVCLTDPEKRKYRRLFIHSRLRQALKGDAMAAREIWERHEGKVASVENIVVEKLNGSDEAQRSKEPVRGRNERIRLSRRELNEIRELCDLPPLPEE
jgi:hypothetical protein